MANARLLLNNGLIRFSPGIISKCRYSDSKSSTSVMKSDENRKLAVIKSLPQTISQGCSDIVVYNPAEDDIIVEEQPDLSLLYGMPEEHVKERLVRIAKAPKSPMQSGTDNTHSWIMQFETRERWENPLIGWCSSGDPLSNLQIRFNTAEEAMEFCDKNRWEFYVEKEKPVTSKKKSYGFNFSWDKRTRVSTK